ncbi:hypothetical protein EQW78_01375 [Oerskovia turbata]|uniref:PH domain-containing protein n=1 Tax=Oerskovia turbata TaxID=1713 RepID=A0A4Q1L159_9CELL|nr:PH domain-containing protein [Oerskovia turbata]RXR26320.1 hypothetical protein EQW73_08315 [Oerskovia turbata]RXR36495.1 hypothetical protein EQW78_01375 [Oerskovia turbata]TGJ97506.1 hypothetical protein DLJ96_06010 [Actinotalea fermentans ATCC 43279 = JCM 9966 = DSM 3133]
MGPTHVFRSTYGRMLTGAAALVALVTLVSLATSGGVEEVLRYGAWPLLALLVVWALFWYPEVQVSDGEIVLRNVLRTVQVPWPTFRSVDAHLALKVTTTSGTFTAWAAPASSGSVARLRNPRTVDPARGMVGDRLVSGANADAAALVIGERYEALRSAGHLDGHDHGLTPRTTWHVATVAGLVVLTALGVLAPQLG